MKKFFTPFISFLLLFFSGAVSAQQTVTINPSKDNTLYESSTGSLSNGSGQSIFTGVDDNGNIKRAVIMFDIAGNIPAGSLITDVDLTLTMLQTTAGSSNVSLHTLTADWGEAGSIASGNGGGGGAAQTGDATWLHTFYNTSFWTTPGGDFNPSASATTSVGGGGIYLWTSTPMINDVQNWLGNPASNYGWILIGDESTSPTAKRFASSENSNISQWPVLSVTFIAPCNAPDIPTLSTSGSPICAGEPVNITVNGNLNDATHWTLYEDSCGGLPVSISGAGIFTVFPTTTTTYYVRGEGGCVTPGACANIGITPFNVDTSVTQTMATLIANTSNGTYQWVDCDNNYAPISGATNQSFNPSVNGNYAVIITDPIGCTDTSSCHNVIIIGINETLNDNYLSVYPNPFKDNLTVVYDKISSDDLLIQLVNANGKIVETINNLSKKELDTSSISPGVYLLRIIDKGNLKTLAEKTIIKQ